MCVFVYMHVCVTSAGQSHVLPCYNLHIIEKINEIYDRLKTEFDSINIINEASGLRLLRQMK